MEFEELLDINIENVIFRHNFQEAFSISRHITRDKLKGAIIRGRGMCGTFQSFLVISADVPCTNKVHRDITFAPFKLPALLWELYKNE